MGKKNHNHKHKSKSRVEKVGPLPSDEQQNHKDFVKNFEEQQNQPPAVILKKYAIFGSRPLITGDGAPGNKSRKRSHKESDDSSEFKELKVIQNVLPTSSNKDESPKKKKKMKDMRTYRISSFRSTRKASFEATNEEEKDAGSSISSYDSIDEISEEYEQYDEEDDEISLGAEEGYDDDDELSELDIEEGGFGNVSLTMNPSFEDESEDEDEQDSIDDSFDITGYTKTTNSSTCVVLEANKNFAMGSLPFRMFCFSAETEHSVQVGLKALSWIIAPMDIQIFFEEFFQKRVLAIKRNSSNYFEGFFSTNDFISMVENNHLEYIKNINIASYVNGERQTHNPKDGGRVISYGIKKHLLEKRSVQCINPQSFNDHIWYLCEILQEVFCSFVGANNYLTPAGSSGFAPHWDDVDAFMLQTEGRKHWKIYSPKEKFPLHSSGNFTDLDFSGQEPVFAGWLEQGDLLYVPRGFIHQAHTNHLSQSHHVTVSVCREFTFTNLIEKAITNFSDVITMSSELRQSLPPHIFDCTGVADQSYGESSALNKITYFVTAFIKTIAKDFLKFIPSTIDSMAREFMKNALPPLLSKFEKEHSCISEVDFNLSTDVFKFDKATEIRLIRKHAQRLVFESENSAFLTHRMMNPRFYGCNEGSIIDFPVEYEQGYKNLANNYPQWTKISNLGLDIDPAKELAKILYDNCLLLVKDPETKNIPTSAESESISAKGTGKSSKEQKRKRKEQKKHMTTAR